MKKRCNNCALQLHSLCSQTKKKVCDKWINEKANCRFCTYANSCITLGRKTGNFYFCTNFSIGKRNDPTIFHDYEEYKAKKDAEKQLKKLKESSHVDRPLKKKKPKPPSALSENDRAILSNEDRSSPLWSPLTLIDKVISSDYDPDAFALVKDGDLPKTSNIITFIMDPRFLNYPLYPRQLQVCLDFFAAYCPDCSNTKFIREKIEVDTDVDNILDRTVLYINGVCPRCGKTRYEAVTDKKHNSYVTLCIAAGQRSGKSALIWALGPAIVHEYLQMSNPVKTMRQLPNTIFYSTFVGINFEDTFKNIWDPMHKLVTMESPWFKQYHQFLTEESRRIGVELFKVKDTFISYTYKGIHMYPSGPDYRNLRGKSRICGAIDEAAYLTGKDASIMLNAKGCYDAIDNSLATLRAASEILFRTNPGVPSAYGLYTSSTRSKLDFIMTLYKRSKGAPHIYGRKLATWEYNPNMPRDSSFIKAKYLEDPQAAERDYGSNPPFSTDPFIKSPATIVPLFTKKNNVFAIQKYMTAKDTLDGKTIYPIVSMHPHSYPSVLALDAGWKNNSFALTLSSFVKKADSDEDNSVVATTGIIEIQPKEDMPLNFPRIYEKVIYPICNTYDVKLVVADRWQSLDIVQKVEQDFSIPGFMYSVNYHDFESLRRRIHSETWLLPRLDGDLDELLKMHSDIPLLTNRKPVSHLMLQLLISSDDGRHVTKGKDSDDMTDDILRSACLGIAILDDPEYEHLFTASGTDTTGPTVFGTSVGISSGKGGTNMSVPGVGMLVTLK